MLKKCWLVGFKSKTLSKHATVLVLATDRLKLLFYVKIMEQISTETAFKSLSSKPPDSIYTNNNLLS